MATDTDNHAGGAIKLDNPQPFKGERHLLDNFILKCEMIFQMNSGTYNTSKKKISFIMYHLDGIVQQWRNSKMSEYDETPAKWNNYNAFKQELKNSWGEVNSSATATTYLFKYKKHPNVPMATYVATQDQNLRKAGITDDNIKITFMIMGLPPRNQQRIMDRGIKTYDELVSALLNMDISDRVILSASGLSSHGGRSNRDPDAMEIDLTSMGSTSTSQFNKCYGCRQTGHFIANCPNKSTKGAQNKGKGPSKKGGSKNRGKGKGKRNQRHIRAADAEGDDDEAQDDSNQGEADTHYQMIRQIVTQLPAEVQTSLFECINQQGF
jgi:hypothetical protein